ncbi:MAG: D-glycero-beta-D-manno-heptose-7-phosphate kinase [bacterium]
MDAVSLKVQLDYFLERVSGYKVLLLGDIMLDEYHFCDVTRISPEAPVPICSVTDTKLLPGGAANVACNLRAINADVFLLGVYGNDGSGARLKAVLEQQSIDTSYLCVSKSCSTILKSRIVSQNQQIVRVDRDMNDGVSETDQRMLQERVDSLLTEVEVVVLSDYGKGVITEAFCQSVIAAAKMRSIPVVVDPKGRSFDKYCGATVITPNFSEFSAVVGGCVETEEQLLAKGNDLCARCDLDALLVTRSEKGMSLLQSGKKVDIPTHVQEISDVTGAGDTVVAFFSLALAMGISFEKAAVLANLAAGVVVGKFGACVATPDDLRQALLTYE